MMSEKKKQEQREQFLATRRQFLKLGPAMAGAAGLLSVMNKRHVAEAATKEVLGAGVRSLGYEEGWLGTSKIVGPIQRTSEIDIGFYKAARGLFGEEAKKQVARFIPKHPLGGAISSMRKFLATEEAVNGPPAPEKLPIPDPERMTEHIKKTAKFLRADEVGVGLLPEYAIYTHKAPPLPLVLYEGKASLQDLTPVVNDHKYAIAILIDQDLYTTLGSTGYDGISGSQSMMAYLTAGLIACTLAAYIRNLGYSARAHHCANYQVVVPPVLISCGLGEMSRTGEAAIHPRLGFRHKAAVVTTNLPLVPDGPIDFGVREFCSKCKKCAEQCPSGAISFDEDQSEYNGYMKWVNSIEKCTQFRVGNREGSSCGRCMVVCPWNSKEDSWFHSAGTYVASLKSGMADSFLREIDDMFGYGVEVVEENRWWLEWPELY